MNIIIVTINGDFRNTIRAGDQKLMIDLEWPYYLEFLSQYYISGLYLEFMSKYPVPINWHPE